MKKKKILFAATDQSLLPVMEALTASGRYEVVWTTGESMMDAVAREMPQVLFLDGQSTGTKGKDNFKRIFEFQRSTFKDAVRMIVLNPSELEADVLFGPQFVSSPHTCEKLVAVIEETWGKATEQPFNLDLFVRERPGRSENFKIKERRLHYSTYANKELESQRCCTPTSDQWQMILKGCHDVDIWSFPSEWGDLMAEDGFRYYVRVRTFDHWLESDGNLGTSPVELSDRLLRLREVLYTVLNAAPAEGAGERAALQNSPEDSLSAFRVRVCRPNSAYFVQLVAGKLCYHLAPGYRSRWSPGYQISPSAEQWNDLWQAVNAVNLWDWKRSYVLPPKDPIVEPVLWEIAIQRADARAVLSRGYDAYPAEDDSDRSVALGSARFRMFVDAVRRLIGDRPFR